MRAEHAEDRWFVPAAGVVVGAVGLTAGFLAAGPWGGAAGLGLGAASAWPLSRVMRRRSWRRRALLALPFPEAWRRFLLESYDHYQRLPSEWRRRFEDDLKIFLAEKRITGVEVEVTDELRLLVAASAVTLSLGWPDYEWDQLTEVLLYPQDFDRDWGFEEDELAGQAHPWGTVILSVPSLHESFEDPDDAYHVGLHEFAHLLDVEQTRFDGIPMGLSRGRAEEWVALVESEMARLRKGKSVLDPYGAEDPVEFLAVAVEAFFEAPLALRQQHRQLYDLLEDYFAQDPAAWDQARGLRL